MFDLGGLVSYRGENRATPETVQELSGPESICYAVNMPSPSKKKSRSKNPTAGRTRSTSRGRLSHKDSIAKILDLCKNTNHEVSKIRERLDKTTSDISEIKEKVVEVQERLEKVESETGGVVKKVETLEKNQLEMEKRIEERLMLKLGVRAKIPLNPPTSMQQPTVPVESQKKRVMYFKAGEETQRESDAAGKKIHEAFKELLKVPDSRKQTFLVGVVESVNENGAQMRPLLNYKLFVRRFFDGVRYEEGKLGLAQSTGLPLGRVTVHRDDVHVMKLRVCDGWRGARDLGWWVGQENPVDLRQMETNAFRFIMETKKECEGLRRFYLEVDDGFLRFQGAPFLPVYMIPADKELWPRLAEVLLKMVKSLRAVSWIDRFRRDLRKLDPGLLEEWSSIFRMSGDEGQRPTYRVSDDNIRVLGKLRAMGRVPRQAELSRGVSVAATSSSSIFVGTGTPPASRPVPFLVGSTNSHVDTGTPPAPASASVNELSVSSEGASDDPSASAGVSDGTDVYVDAEAMETEETG
jgi:hypothetical protein